MCFGPVKHVFSSCQKNLCDAHLSLEKTGIRSGFFRGRNHTPKMMKVGFNVRYLHDYNLRGFNRYTVCLLTELQKHSDIQIHLYSEKKFPVHQRFQWQLRAPTHVLSAPKTLVWEQVILPVALRRHSVDVFHAPADGGLPWIKTAKYILTFHHDPITSLENRIGRGELHGQIADFVDIGSSNGFWGQLGWKRTKIMQGLYLRAADLIIAVSEFSKWELVHLLNVPEEKIRVIYLGPDGAFRARTTPAQIQALKAKYGIQRPYLLFVSGFDKRKNVATLLEVYAELKSLGVSECLVLVGSGGDVDVTKKLAETLGLVEKRDVFFLENIYEDLPVLYQGATLFITLSWEESFCFPLVEAMASGTPVVASCFGAIPEIMGDAGLTVDPRDVVQVVRAVKQLLDNSGLQQDLRARSLRRGQLFSWEKTAKETLKVYEEATRIRFPRL